MPSPIVISGSTQTILNKLRIVQTYDTFIEQKLRLFKTIMIIAWICVAVCFFLLPFMVMLYGLPVIAALGVAIYATVNYVKYNKEDIENRRFTIPQRFFEVLGRDIPAKRRCSLHVDCDGYLKHGQQIRSQSPSGFFSSAPKQTVYKDQWFTAKGTLCDHTIFRVNITQCVHRKEKRKRKYTKVSERISERINLRLRIAPDAYPNWAMLASALKPQGNEQLSISNIVVKDSTVQFAAVTKPMRRVHGRSGVQVLDNDTLVTADMLLQLFLFVYAQLGQCRTQQPDAAR
ncbi:MAG TPA: hypothetical protein VHV83_20850 [Armatimonadota bacterium]|nr:hypothetical protein [Armatimonadota bacterium]